MALLAGIRNLIGRRREPADDQTPPVPGPVEIEVGLREEIEAKPVEPDQARAIAAEVEDEDDDETDLLDSDELDDIEEDDEDEVDEIDEVDIAERLDEMETRLGAGGADIHRLVKTLDGNVESHAARSADLVQQLDERIQSKARETQEVVRQLDERFGAVAEESRRLAEQVERLPELAGEVAGINAQCDRLLKMIDEQIHRSDSLDKAINTTVTAAAKRLDEAADRSGATLEHLRTQLDATAGALAQADSRFEDLSDDLRQIQARTAGLDEAIKRIGRSMKHWEETFPALLNRTRKSMLMFVFLCTALGALALVAAVAALMT